MKYLRLALGLVLAGSFFASSTNAAIITYNLSDKDPGAQNPPDYGLRIDGLFGVEISIWTFSFDSTDVKMVIDTSAQTAHIFGNVIGGKDVGTSWGTEYSWYLDFMYTDIMITDTTTGYWHAVDVGGDHINLSNSGTLELLSDEDVDGVYGGDGSDKGEFIAFADYKGGDFFLSGSKGPYVSAWLANTSGFVDDPSSVVLADYNRFGACCKDFGFKATQVPEPGTLGLLGAGLLGLAFARRKKAA
ncbi:MAG: PEP-CTERM sorting domain-containing protein [Acidiferrobacterales bacterium]